MKDILVTYVQGEKFISNFDCEVFLNSLKKHKSFDKLCIVKDISNESRKNLEKYFDFVIDPKHPIAVPNNDRFMAYYEWLVDKDYEYVFHVDFRDVIIQRNPFEYMRNHPAYNLFITTEGMRINQCECNTFWAEGINKLLQYHHVDYKDHVVNNSGTIGGKIDSFLWICLMFFTNTNRKAPHVVFEQPILNYIAPYLAKNPLVKICHPLETPFIATGEGIKRGFVNVKFDGKKILDLNDEPYYIVHQWDRLEWAEKIRDNQKSTFSFF
jgi:hypothetical protein